MRKGRIRAIGKYPRLAVLFDRWEEATEGRVPTARCLRAMAAGGFYETSIRVLDGFGWAEVFRRKGAHLAYLVFSDGEVRPCRTRQLVV